MECESFRTFEIEHLNLERMNDSFTVRTSPKVGMILFGIFRERVLDDELARR